MLRRVLPTHDQTAGTTQLCRERSDFRWLKADQSKLIQPLAESLRERELGQRAGSDASLGVFVRHWVCRSDQAACLKASCSVEDGLGDRARCPAQRSLGLLRRNGSPFPQFVEPAPDNRIEQRRHPRDKIGHRNEWNLPRLVAKSLLEYLGDVVHPIEIAGANKTLPRSFWHCHRQHMQA